mmetsp:Transcript_101714/g.242571  ORF Transcript_101714/g.242571 Transcript_101714/m.242571 type:complete len:178 (-) Transcript_101714:10-543(-)
MVFPTAGSLGLPPTRFALKARPYFMALLGVQAALMVARFLILDVWGALLSLLILTLGTFVLSSGAGVDTGYCLYFGLMCLVNGMFDAILFLERAIHVKSPLFSRAAPLVFNAASVVYLTAPVVELAAASLAAAIYVEASEQESRLLMPALAQLEISNDGEARHSEQFRAFTGRGYHI